MRLSRLSFVLASLFLSGCVSSPTTTPQATALAPETLGLGPTAAPVFADDWWTAFQDPQVNRLAAALVGNNPTLAGAMARIRSAQATLSVNRANNLPQLSLDAAEQRESVPQDYIYPPPYAGTDRWIGQTLANLNWTLDFWGRQAALIEGARDTATAASLDAAAARLALSGAFAQTYIDLLLAYENEDIANQTIAERGEVFKLTQNRVNSGLENNAALEQARALLSFAKIDAMRAAAQRDMDVHAIAALTGQGANAYHTITRPQPNLDSALPLPTSLPADLLARRPDILAARARVDAAAQGRIAAHAEYYPNINIAAFIGFQAIGLSNLLTSGGLTYGAGPAIHLPIFDAGRIRANEAGATARLDSAVADYNGAVLSAIRQASDAMTQVKSLETQRGEQQIALDSAARAFKLAETRYKDGLSGQIPLLTAESTLLQAREQMAALVANSAVQRITLLLSVGGGFTPGAQNDTAQSKIEKQDNSP